MERPVVRVAVVGAGAVGAALIGLLRDESRVEMLIDAAGARLELVGVAVRDLGRDRPGVPRDLLVGDAAALVTREDVDVVVELAGGLGAPRELIDAAMAAGKSVVTANKALMAAQGTELIELARERGVDLFYEGAVAGGIPILRALRTSLAGERIERVMGIVNGTTNFILTQMATEGVDYERALKEAQALGFAESDPSADVEGHDAAAKISILSSLAFGTALAGAAVHREGITHVSAADVDYATQHGYVIKLLGIAERLGGHGVSRRVHPAMVPTGHPLAAVSGAFNAVFVEGAVSGPLMWLGQGAGGGPSAAAVLGDVVAAARNRVAGRCDTPLSVDPTLVDFPLGELQSIFYLAVDVLDRPGVLASVAAVFGEHSVSIKKMEQIGFGDEARLTFLTHMAFESDIAATLEDLGALDVVDRVGSCIRIVGESEP
jgi:homoserine dehydrogenase